MKISIGEIIDRYTICKLKSERTGLDNGKEMDELWKEIVEYENYKFFVNRLYVINGQMWTLEADLRKGNDELLGIDEIGRRAIEIRNLNILRVDVKNELNSIFGEGYNETKIFHGSEKYPSVIITLTTVPDRLNTDIISPVIISICEQNDDDYDIHFNIPYVYNMTNEKYIIPDWLNKLKLKYPHLKVYRTEDFGPATKIIPTIKRIINSETIIIVVDDDHTYDKDMVIEHRKYQNLLPDSALCYRGKNSTLDGNSIGYMCVIEPIVVSYLLHYMSASYKKKIFNDDFYTLYVGKTFSDDILISRYMTDHGIPIYVIPYEKDKHYETYKLYKNRILPTFPVTKMYNFENSGGNHPNMLKIQPRFYHPTNLGIKNIRLI